MKPLGIAGVAAVAFAVGLFVAHEADARLHDRIDAEIRLRQAQLSVCQEERGQAMALLEVQQGVLARQYRLLSDISPIVSRAIPSWPWGRQDEAKGGF